MPRKGGGIGQALERFENARLLRGLGRYSADLRLPGSCVGHVLRSPHAQARIAAVETARRGHARRAGGADRRYGR